MSTHNVCFYGELTKMIFLLSSNTLSLSVLALPTSFHCTEPFMFTFHRLEMTDILLKGHKTLTHPSIFICSSVTVQIVG